MLTLLVLLIPAAFGAGMFAADRMMRLHWQRHRFCPNCLRLDCPREHGDVRYPPGQGADA